MELFEYPRVLVVGQSFDLVTGGGITLSNLFTGWPKDRIAFTGSISFPPNVQVCEKYYKLGSDDIRMVWPLMLLTPYSDFSGELSISFQPETGFEGMRIARLKRTPVREKIHLFVELFGLDQIIRRVHLTPKLAEWAASFQPDLIYTQAASLHVMRLTDHLLKLWQVPLVIHMMDDWPTTLYKDKILAPYLRWQMGKEFAKLLNRSTIQMGISTTMCRAFQERYQKPFLPFHNPIDLSQWMSVSRKNWNASTPFRLFYAGRIGTANQASLKDVCNAVAELHGEGKQVRLDLHTLDYNSEMGMAYQRSGCVYVNPPIPYKDMPQALAKADTLILPLDFDSSSIRFARYSMPTKTSEYMASGTPVLVYAPDKMAVSDYAQQEQWGCVVAKRTLQELKQSIVELMNDQPFRERLGRRAQELTVQNHDAVKVREAFRLALVNAVKKSKM
jgi:glycosyltransferase involved in cell wall biosynthesis